jgi:hypothetical protein
VIGRATGKCCRRGRRREQEKEKPQRIGAMVLECSRRKRLPMLVFSFVDCDCATRGGHRPVVGSFMET